MTKKLQDRNLVRKVMRAAILILMLTFAWSAYVFNEKVVLVVATAAIMVMIYATILRREIVDEIRLARD